MIEATVIKSIVLQDKDTQGTVLMGVAQHNDDQVNFKVAYDWLSLDVGLFLDDLRNKLAEDFDIPVYRVDLRERELVQKMKQYSEWLEKTKSVIIH